MMLLGVGMFGAAAAGLVASVVQGAFAPGAMLYLGWALACSPLERFGFRVGRGNDNGR
jgi:hypothetical protein